MNRIVSSTFLLFSAALFSSGGHAQEPGTELRKVIVHKNIPAEVAAARQLKPVRIFDYPDRQVLVVTASSLQGARAQNAALRENLPVWEDGDQIYLRGRTLDTRKALAEVPQALRRAPTSGPQLYLVQLAGPVKPEWLNRIKATGQVQIVTYVPTDAYLIWTDGPTIARIETLKEEGFVQWTGPFHPAYALHPSLASPGLAGPQRVTVQLVDHPGVEASIANVKARAQAVLRDVWTVAGYRNLRIEVAAADLPAIVALPDVVNVEPFIEPRTFGERQGQILANQLNAAGSQPTGPGYLAWLNARGFVANFDFVVDVTDDGFDRGEITAANVHPDFLDSLGNSRVAYVQKVSGTFINTTEGVNRNVGGHGTINASIVAGLNNVPDSPGNDFEDAAGFNYGMGIAPFARVGSSKILPWTDPDFTELLNSAYSQGARISSNSWGAACDTPDGCCPAGVLGSYNVTSLEYDSLVRDARPGTALDGGQPGNQEMVVVFAAGNHGECPDEDLGNDGSTAKNTLVVGASENFNQAGTDGSDITNSGADDARDIIFFSSRGPVGDNRVKPDLMAPGTHIFGAASQDPSFDGSSVSAVPGSPFFPAGQTLYTWSSGTSQAAPAVSGAAALLRQWFLNQGRPEPSPAMTKAYLMNAATYMTGTGANDTLPSNNQGMGRLNLERSLDAVPRLLFDQLRTFGASGETFTVTGTIPDPAQPFRVALAWTDAPGAVVGGAWVNNLNLEVTVNGNLFRGNVFTGGQSQTGGTADPRNNVESVWLPAGTTGDFTITVRAFNIAGDGVPHFGDGTDQDFALVVYNAELPERTPADIVLVLDTSGSMGDASPGGSDTKIQLLRDAAEMFMQAWLPYSIPTDRIGVVYFNSGITTVPAAPPILQPFQPNAAAILNDVRGRSAGGWTALGGGLQTALNALAGSPSPNRKFILLFTNGMQNFSPMVVDVGGGHHEIQTAAVGSTVDGVVVHGDSGVAGAPGVNLASHGVTIHTIGTGVSGAQWEDLIEAIATETSGLHHFTSTPDFELELFFLNDLVTSLRGTTLEMVAYRNQSFSAGETQKTETFTLNASVKKATFLVSWRGQRAPGLLTFDLVKREGSARIPIPRRSIDWTTGDFYTLGTVTFPVTPPQDVPVPILNTGAAGPGSERAIVWPAGEWELIVHNGPQAAAMPFHTGLLVDDSDLEYEALLPPRDYGVGEPIPLSVRLTDGPLPVTLLTRAEVAVGRPPVGLGTFLAQNPVSAGQLGQAAGDPDNFSTPVAKKQLVLVRDAALRAQLAPVASTLPLFDDGSLEHGDAAAGDGVFSNLFRDTTRPGHYSFEFRLEGRAPITGAFARRESMATSVRIKAVDPAGTKISFLPDREERGHYTAVITPLDSFGNYLGPGFGHKIRLSPIDGRLIGDLIDNLDGSYSQIFESDPGRQGGVRFDVDGTVVEGRPGMGTSGWELSPFLGFFAFDGALPIEDGAVFGLRAGKSFTQRLALEGELGVTPTDDLSGNRGDVIQWNAGLLVHFAGPSATVRPFATLGFGLLAFEGFTQDEESIALDFGLGLKIRLGSILGLRLDVRDYLIDGAYGSGNANNWQATGGLTLYVP